MDARQNDGPAFPHSFESADGHPRWMQSSGMSLLDYFAGQIAVGMAAYSGTSGLGYGPGDIATRSYEVARSMVAARAALKATGG